MAAGDISDALVEKLGIRMENPEGNKFTVAMRFNALNSAQKKAAQFLNPMYLAELEYLDASVSTTAGVAALSDLAASPLNGKEGVLVVEDADADVGLTKTTIDEQKALENTLLTSDKTNPTYFIFASNFYCTGLDTADGNIAVFFLQVPTTMTTDVDPILNSSLHGIMLSLAAAQLWAGDAQLDRRASELNKALSEIERLNAEAKQITDIGTSRFKRLISAGGA